MFNRRQAELYHILGCTWRLRLHKCQAKFVNKTPGNVAEAKMDVHNAIDTRRRLLVQFGGTDAIHLDSQHRIVRIVLRKAVRQEGWEMHHTKRK